MIKLFKFYKMRKNISGLLDMIEYINNFKCTSNMRMIEIGSYIGDSTLIFSDYFKEVISIDPYKNTYPNIENLVARKYAPWRMVKSEFIIRTKNKNNIRQINKTSDEAIVELRENNFDFVYIDGNHSFQNVISDIRNYIKIINCGFIGGHDYTNRFREVKAAVKYTIGVPDILFRDSSWLKFIGINKTSRSFKDNTKLV